MSEVKVNTQQTAQVQKMVSLKEDGYYSNCSMVEGTPFDISILFGKVRPRTDEKGQTGLVEVYERQVYLSHLQARALHDALGRSLRSMTPQTTTATDESTAQKERTQQ
jgi:hypothetical protein